MKPNYRAMIAGNPGIKAEARKLVRKGIIKLTKQEKIKAALENRNIRVVAVNRDGDLQLDLGYLLQIKCDAPGRFILWRRSQKVPVGRLESAFTVSGKNWADQLAGLVGGTEPMLMTF